MKTKKIIIASAAILIACAIPISVKAHQASMEMTDVGNTEEIGNSHTPTIEIDRDTGKKAKQPPITSEILNESYENDRITLFFGTSETYILTGEKSSIISQILLSLSYDENKLCKCLPEYTVDLESNSPYGINLTEGYARCHKGQAELTKQEIAQIKDIVAWAKKQTKS